MRDYAKVSPSFWSRGSGKRLRGDADGQVLALYLCTCPAANMIGVYYVPFVAVAHETGLGLPRAEAAMARLQTAGFAYYDTDAELAWVPNMAAYQIGETMKAGDKRRGAVLAELDKLGEHPFVMRFVERYGRAYSLAGDWTDFARVGAPTLGDDEDADPSVPPSPSKGACVDHARGIEGASTILGKSRRRAGEEQEQEVAASAAPALPGVDLGDREGPICMRLDWEPTPEHAESVRAKGLHVGRVVEDFRGHWAETKKRKTPANWNRTFAENIRRICREAWLLERFRLTEAELARASWPAIDPPSATEMAVSEAEADAAVKAALDALSEHTRPLRSAGDEPEAP